MANTFLVKMRVVKSNLVYADPEQKKWKFGVQCL